MATCDRDACTATAPATRCEVELLRAGEPVTVDVTLGSTPPPGTRRRATRRRVRRSRRGDRPRHGATRRPRGDGRPTAAVTADADRRPARRPRPRAAERGPVGLPARAAPVRRARRAARHHRARGARAHRDASRSRRAAPALGDLRHPRARLHARRSSRPRSTPTASTTPPRSSARTRASATTTSATTRTTSGTRSRSARASRSTSTSTCCTATSGALVTRKLPTLKLYKIGVKLDMTGKTAAERQGRGARARAARAHARDMDAPELSDLEVAAIRVVQEDLPLVERPFAAQAEQIGVDEDDRARRCSRSFKERKLMRRFAAVMNHRSAGFKANAMGVWAVPDDAARRDRPADGRLRRREPLLPAARPTTTGRTRVFTMVHGQQRHATARRRSTRSATRPASTSTRCCGRSRSTRRPACATSPPSGTSGAPAPQPSDAGAT